MRSLRDKVSKSPAQRAYIQLARYSRFSSPMLSHYHYRKTYRVFYFMRHLTLNALR